LNDDIPSINQCFFLKKGKKGKKKSSILIIKKEGWKRYLN